MDTDNLIAIDTHLEVSCRIPNEEIAEAAMAAR